MKLRHFDGFAVLVVIVVFACAMLSHAQIAGSYVQPVTGPTYSVPDHPQHADQGTLRAEVSLLGSNGVTTAHGELPLSDFPSDKREPSLGEVARAYRQEHAKAEKAVRVWCQ
jgi:hypothetical protein